MKTRIVLFLLFPVFLLSCSSTSMVTDGSCEVKVENLKGHYEGYCKRGLAHGEGLAEGKDKYKGEFNKGYPEGKGKLTFSNGDVYIGEFLEGKMHGEGHLQREDGTTKVGFWRNNEYKGETIEDFQGYKIVRTVNVDSPPQFRKLSQKNNVIFEITGNREVKDFALQEYSSGNLSGVNQTVGRVRAEILNVNYPFSGQISYKVQNKSANFFGEVVIEFEIYEKGEWSITSIHN